METYDTKQFWKDVEANKDNLDWLTDYDEIMKYSWRGEKREWVADNKLIPALVVDMLKYAGYEDVTYSYLKENPWIEDLNWYEYYHWTMEQEQEWRNKRLIPMIMKFLQINKSRANSEAGWFMLCIGLTCMEDEKLSDLQQRNRNEREEQCKRFNKTADEWLSIKKKSMDDKTSVLAHLIADRYNITTEYIFEYAFNNNVNIYKMTDSELDSIFNQKTEIL